MVRINVQAADTWKYLQDHAEELDETMVVIGSDSETGVAIYITKHDEYAQFVVMADDMVECEDFGVSESDCEKTVSKLYETYLYNYVNSTLSAKADDDGRDEEIEMRDIQLQNAIEDFLDIAIEDSDVTRGMNVHEYTEMVDDLKEHFLEYMYRRWGLLIYRPMYLEDEKGETFFEEYPYQCLEFDDAPLYPASK